MLGLGLLRSVLSVKLVVLGGLAIAAYEGWTLVRPKPWGPNDLQKAAAEAVCWDAAKAIPAGLPGIKKLAVLQLSGNDSDGYVTSKLAECIHRVGRYNVQKESVVGNVLKELGLNGKPVSTLAVAAKAGRSMGVDGVVIGDVVECTSDEKSASIRIELRVANVANGEAPFGETFSAKEPPPLTSVAGVSRAVRASSVVKRILIWLAFAALLPVVLIPMIKHFLERESNAVNFALLLGLTLADLALAYVLCGMVASEWLPAAAVVGSVVAGGGYNYWLCSTIEKLRK